MVDTGAAGAAGLDAGLGEDLARAALALARRFAAGATMWCVAPAWPEHARHVAVEFVHPVIMGKRALPAVSVDDPDPVAALRATVRAGDILVAVSPADDAVVQSADAPRRGVGGHDAVDRSPAPARRRARPTTSCGSTTPAGDGARTTAGSCCCTTCSGS